MASTCATPIAVSAGNSTSLSTITAPPIAPSVQYSEHHSIQPERNGWKEEGIKELYEICSICRRKYSCGYNHDDGAAIGSWSYFRDFGDDKICSICIQKMSKEESDTRKSAVVAAKAERERKSEAAMWRYDPCLICRQEALKTFVRNKKQIDVCEKCRLAVMSMRTDIPITIASTSTP